MIYTILPLSALVCSQKLCKTHTLTHCCIVWSPMQQTLIYELVKIQKTFTKKIRGMEELDYHKRLKSLGMYSLERWRDRYMIIYRWQQLVRLKEKVLKLEASSRGTSRTIMPKKPPFRVEDRRLGTANKTILYNSPSSKVHHLFNSLPRRLRNMTGVSTDTFKDHLDRWL